MSSLERLIVQNISHNKLKENLRSCCDNSTDIDRQISDLLELYELMLEKGYDNLPENTSEKKSFREIESKLIELGAGIRKSKEIKSKEIPGDFHTRQDVL